MANTSEFRQPADSGATIWRYMDFSRFVAMLEKRALFFPRITSLRDPFEGSYTFGESHPPAEESGGTSITDPGELQKVLKAAAEVMGASQRWDRKTRACICVNCWHMNQFESEAMWRLYCPSGAGIALRTRYSNLCAQLPENVYVGIVSYIDYSTEEIPDQFTMNRFMHKRKAFEHEHEVRALIRTEEAEREGGYWQAVDFEDLIGAIHVSPLARPWYYNLVRRVVKRYAVSLKVLQSEMNEPPAFF